MFDFDTLTREQLIDKCTELACLVDEFEKTFQHLKKTIDFGFSMIQIQETTPAEPPTTGNIFKDFLQKMGTDKDVIPGSKIEELFYGYCGELNGLHYLTDKGHFLEDNANFKFDDDFLTRPRNQSLILEHGYDRAFIFGREYYFKLGKRKPGFNLDSNVLKRLPILSNQTLAYLVERRVLDYIINNCYFADRYNSDTLKRDMEALGYEYVKINKKWYFNKESDVVAL